MQGLYLYRSPRLLCVFLERESVIIFKFDLRKFILSQCLALLCLGTQKVRKVLYVYRSPRLLYVLLQRESVIIFKFDLQKFILSQCLAFPVFWDTEGKERFILLQNVEVAACASRCFSNS